MKSIFDAANAGDLAAVRRFVEQGADIAAKDQYGFTALHCAATACNRVDEQTAVALLDLLLKAGAPVNALSSDGRTVLYLAAEFSRTLGPVKLLIQAGANADVSAHGVHIVINAMAKEVQSFLSELTGRPLPLPVPKLKEVKLSAPEWRAVKGQVDIVFEMLERAGLVVVQNAGDTQDDGLVESQNAFVARGGLDARLVGCCFYTKQDLARAKRSSILPLAFWGAPDGADGPTTRVGELVVNAFRDAGFTVQWDGSPKVRPIVYLQGLSRTRLQ